MMKSAFAAICCLALIAAPAFAQKKHAHEKAPATPLTDQQFIDMAAKTDMLEAHLGQMAANQAASQEVKDYAQMLVTDHTNDYQQLTEMATKDNLTVPKGLDDEQNKVIASFDKLNGKAFDERYIHTMIEGHTKAIEVYTKESNDAQSADVESYAAATLPTLNKHLDGAKGLEKKPAAGKKK
jgi:putative membrane protein